MAVAKVIYKSSANATPETWMDVTQDTVESDKLLASYTATKNDGTSITGSYSAPLLQSKTVTPTTSTQSILPDSGFGGMSQVTVNAITLQSKTVTPQSYEQVITPDPPEIILLNSTYNMSSLGRWNITFNTLPIIGETYHFDISLIRSGYNDRLYTFNDNVVWNGSGTTITVTAPSGAQTRVLTFYDTYVTMPVTDEDTSPSPLTITVLQEGVEYSGLSSVTVEAAGGSDTEDAVIMRTISGIYENSRVTKVAEYAFFRCSSLTSVNFPVCTNININAFQGCVSLVSISFPACTTISAYAFAECGHLDFSCFPVCTSIFLCAFRFCKSLTDISFPACKSIGASAFQNCSSLTSVDFPACTRIEGGAFQYCSSLMSVNFPVCTSIGQSAFGSCSSLTSVKFPACVSILASAFDNCKTLSHALFFTSGATGGYIGSFAFYSCYNLLSLYLLASNCYSLQAANAFNYSPISTYTTSTGGVQGSIFVPASLYDIYRASTNWVTYSDRFVSLTDTEIEALLAE